MCHTDEKYIQLLMLSWQSTTWQRWPIPQAGGAWVLVGDYNYHLSFFVGFLFQPILTDCLEKHTNNQQADVKKKYMNIGKLFWLHSLSNTQNILKNDSGFWFHCNFEILRKTFHNGWAVSFFVCLHYVMKNYYFAFLVMFKISQWI